MIELLQLSAGVEGKVAGPDIGFREIDCRFCLHSLFRVRLWRVVWRANFKTLFQVVCLVAGLRREVASICIRIIAAERMFGNGVFGLSRQGEKGSGEGENRIGGE